MFGMGMPEIIMILAIALIVIGPRKLPDLGRSLGRALREFRKATTEFKSSLNIDDDMGEVRRNFADLNADLKSTLSSAAFGEKPTPAGERAPVPAADPVAGPDPADPSGEPEAAAPDPGIRTGQERGDAGR